MELKNTEEQLIKIRCKIGTIKICRNMSIFGCCLSLGVTVYGAYTFANSHYLFVALGTGVCASVTGYCGYEIFRDQQELNILQRKQNELEREVSKKKTLIPHKK